MVKTKEIDSHVHFKKVFIIWLDDVAFLFFNK